MAIRATEGDYRLVSDQERRWRTFLNDGIGVIAFTFGLASLGTPQPPTTAWICLLFLSLLYGRGLSIHLRMLKTLRNKDRNEREEVVYQIAEKDVLGFRKVIRNYAIFTSGFLFLVFVAISPILVAIAPDLSFFLGVG